MSELVFVRHGQASFGAASYDKLSDRGIEQVRQLRRHWQGLNTSFDCIYSGNLQRQVETARELMPLVAEGEQNYRVHPGFNEYNGDPLMQIYLRDHAGEGSFAPGLQFPIQDARLFQKVFEAATDKWINNALVPAAEDQRFEHWPDFQQRVHSAIDELMERHQNGSRVLISTSGGVIALALQRALGFPDAQVISTNWMVYNSSVTRLRYGQGKLSLTLFNAITHLETPELQTLVTFR